MRKLQLTLLAAIVALACAARAHAQFVENFEKPVFQAQLEGADDTGDARLVMMKTDEASFATSFVLFLDGQTQTFVTAEVGTYPDQSHHYKAVSTENSFVPVVLDVVDHADRWEVRLTGSSADEAIFMGYPEAVQTPQE